MTDKTPAHERAVSEIDDAERSYFARGYYAARNPWRGTREEWLAGQKKILIPDITVRKIVRRVAKDAKALWVDVEEAACDDYISRPGNPRHRIILTKNRRSDVLAAPLLPIAVEYDWRATEHPPVTIRRYQSLWHFRFHGAEGDKIFRRWCERLQTDPTFIKALGFTPTGNPLIAPTEATDDAQRLAA